jgi:hypothetical protein
MCHLQGASFILTSYLKGRNGCVAVIYCKCWWPVCTGCCSIVLLCRAELVRVWSVMSRTLADYIYVYTYISEPGSRGGLASQARTCIGTHSLLWLRLRRMFLSSFTSCNISLSTRTAQLISILPQHCKSFQYFPKCPSFSTIQSYAQNAALKQFLPQS